MAAFFSNIARPYALAAFDYAREHQQLAAWKVSLESAAIMAAHPVVAKSLSNPQVSVDELFQLFCDVLATQLDQERKNFLLLLSQNKCLMILPAVSEAFNAYYAALEKISHVRVVTAVAATDDFKQKLQQALAKRIQHEVTLHCEIEDSILGGAVVHIGDRVIDGSVRGKLNRLLEFSLR